MQSFLKSFQYASKGIKFAWEGRNFKIQFGVALLVVALGFLLNISRNDWVAVTFMIGLVLSFETMNSAIENIVNFVSPSVHPMAGKIKDLAAGAVLILSLISIVIGLLIFLPYVLPLLA